MQQSRPWRLLPHGEQLGRVVRQANVAGIGFVEASYAPALKLEAHRHTDPHFCFVLDGSVREETRRTSYGYGRNTLLYRRAGEVHSQEYGAEGARCFSFFMPEEWNDKHGLLPRDSDVFSGSRNSRPSNLVRRLYAEFHRPDAYAALAMEGLTLELVAEIARIGTPRVTGHVADLRAWLEHIDMTGGTGRIGSFARERGVDAAHLVRSFRRIHGTGPAAFLRRRRLDRAYELVVDTDIALADIAMRTGFFDQSHFTRAFVAAYGVAPGACRKGLKEREVL